MQICNTVSMHRSVLVHFEHLVLQKKLLMVPSHKTERSCACLKRYPSDNVEKRGLWPFGHLINHLIALHFHAVNFHKCILYNGPTLFMKSCMSQICKNHLPLIVPTWCDHSYILIGSYWRPVFLSPRPALCLYLFVHLFLSLSLFVCPSVCPSVCMSNQ